MPNKSDKRIIGFGSDTGNSTGYHTREFTDKPVVRNYAGYGHVATTSYVAGVGYTNACASQIVMPFVRMHPHMFQMRIGSCGGMPRITVSKAAYADMCCIVAEASGEVGWVGTIKREGMNFSIGEIFLPGQRGHAATCEITTEGLGDLSIKILERADGVDVWNSIRFWGHVHPGNDTDPSTQDDEQMKIFREACPDFFVRGILGRGGRMEFTVFVYESGLVFYDVPWVVEENEQDVAERRNAWRETLGSAVKPLHGQAAFHQGVVGTYRPRIRGRMIDGRYVWEDDPKWYEEGEYPPVIGREASTSSPSRTTDDTDVAEDDDVTEKVTTPSVLQETQEGGQSESDFHHTITTCIATITRWKLWRLFRLVRAELEGRGVLADVRKMSSKALESDLESISPTPLWKWLFISEMGIRESVVLFDTVADFCSASLKAKYFPTIDKFRRELAALDKAESYLLNPEHRSSGEKYRGWLRKLWDSLVAYTRQSGIELAMSEAELSFPTPITDVHQTADD